MNILNDFSEAKQLQANNIVSGVKENSKTVKTHEYKPDIIDILGKKVVNQRDINDTVTMPRTIFKGYLCFTAGTAVNAIAAMFKNNNAAKGLSIAGSIISLYGTYNFVKPYLIKEKDLTKKEK